jgi:hypothetical protein
VAPSLVYRALSGVEPPQTAASTSFPMYCDCVCDSKVASDNFLEACSVLEFSKHSLLFVCVFLWMCLFFVSILSTVASARSWTSRPDVLAGLLGAAAVALLLLLLLFQPCLSLLDWCCNYEDVGFSGRRLGPVCLPPTMVRYSAISG